MTNPRHMEELLKIIFLWLGTAFIFMGFLSFIGIAGPTASSMVQEQTMLGIIFSLTGIVFVIVQTVLKMITTNKNRLHSELLSSGTRINGTVEKVYLQKYTQYGGKSPYRILYTYTYQDKVYHHKSCLLWDKPDMIDGDSIMVYTDGLGKATIQVW